MALDRNTLRTYAYDPNRMQSYILQQIEAANNGQVVIADPTNPFVCLLEAATLTATNSLEESKAIIRRKYPALALNPDELYHHISDDQMANMMYIPGEALITFYINVLDMQVQGYTPNGGMYFETIIPIGTEVSVLGTTMTLLNDILVRLYRNGNIFVEQQPNDNEIAYQNVGIIPATLTHDSNGVPFILFEVKMKQVRKISRNIALTPSTGFAQIIGLTDNYYYSEVKYKNSKTGGVYKYLPKSFSEEYIDPLNTSVCVAIFDKNIQFKIPDVYMVEGQISGTLQIDLYETKGKIYLPINQLTNDDFSFRLGDTTKSPQAATSANILIWANSRSIIEGGTNGLSLADLRNSIIQNTTGDIDLPITEFQLDRTAVMNGFEIIKTEDVLTNRQYIANKPLPSFNSELLYAFQDIMFGNIEFTLEDFNTNNQIDVLEKRTIIKSNSVFRNNNGRMTLIDNDEKAGLDELNGKQLIAKLNDVKYYYNPFYYVITHDETISTVEIYDLDAPEVINNKILDKNNTFNQRINVQKTAIRKTEKGYRIYWSVATNSEYDKLDQNNVGYQVKLLLDNDVTYAYFEAKYSALNKAWYVDIESRLNLDENNTLDLQNGDSELFSKRFKLRTTVELISYVIDPNLKDPTNYLTNEIWRFKPGVNYVMFGKESLDIEFGVHLPYLWNKIYSTYSERKYQTYKEDIPLVYEKDEYEVNADIGNIFKVENGKLVYKVKNAKGSPVLDYNKKPLYKARKGDAILDSNGLPVIDQMSGVIRYLDILLMEYEFYRTQSSVYDQYKSMMRTALRDYIITELGTINGLLLEKTQILYKAFKKITQVIVNINNNLYTTDCITKPHVTLYVNGTTNYSNLEIENMKPTIGRIMNNYFDKQTISLEAMRNEIKTALGQNIVSVKIDGIEPTNSEVLNIHDKTTKFIIDKKLELNENSELIVKFNINITVIYL